MMRRAMTGTYVRLQADFHEGPKMSCTPVLRSALVAVIVMNVALPIDAAAQNQYSTDAPWTGWAQCVLVARGGNYVDEQVHTWRLTGEPPRAIGSSSTRHWPGVWSAQGRGSRGGDSWMIVAPEMPGEIGMWEVPATTNIRIQSVHSPLIAPAGVRVTGPSLGNYSLQEHAFPGVEGPRIGPTISGTRTREIPGGPGWRKPFEVLTTETCTWSYTRAGVASAPPPPPTFASGSPGAPAAPPGAMAPATAPPAATPPVAATPPAPGQPATPPSSSGGSQTPPPVASTPTATGAPPTTSSPATGGAVVTPNRSNPGTTPTASTGRLTPVPTAPTSTGTEAPAVTPETARDPADFTARQAGEGTVTLTWTAVPGAGAYLLGGPGTNAGISVNGTSHTVIGIPQGTHTWTVATMYNPGGIMTTADRWSRATATVTNTSGRYRVLITGFRVHRPTFDDRFNGNGDEVYGAVGLSMLDRRNNSVLQPWMVIKSESYGDVGRNPGFVRAGSFGANGGLAAGDVVPPGSDPRMPPAAASATRFPLVAWEGVLRDGIEMLIVKPTLWEIDGELDFYNQWATSRDPDGDVRTIHDAGHQAAAIKDRADRADLSPFRGLFVEGCWDDIKNVIEGQRCAGRDRPIGIHKSDCIGDDGGGSAIRSRWCDVIVVVTREGIERALSGTYQVGGAAPGSITIPLIEPPGVDVNTGGYDGSYELYVRVERVP